ncbi:uncharacterized protein E0L32_006626 [Thyridium curvatum]|uniref:Integral membrane protein n=1 Tax=Thyridium curvatum TaxID=1093900 RepID=A0A507B7E4_9PEZI|nr:uncharacterized protein E0L32_006626 [Thyridium curvatum]TPX12981.1 hypothetical protein E0L32_006626 [Thyridium curvatum]
MPSNGSWSCSGAPANCTSASFSVVPHRVALSLEHIEIGNQPAPPQLCAQPPTIARDLSTAGVTSQETNPTFRASNTPPPIPFSTRPSEYEPSQIVHQTRVTQEQSQQSHYYSSFAAEEVHQLHCAPEHEALSRTQATHSPFQPEGRVEHESYFAPIPRLMPGNYANLSPRPEHESDFSPLPRLSHSQEMISRTEQAPCLESPTPPAQQTQPSLDSRAENEASFAPMPRPPIQSPASHDQDLQQQADQPPCDSMASLSSRITNLSVEDSTRNLVTEGRTPTTQYDAPRPPPACRSAGPDWETLPCCPEDRIITYSLDWYRLPDVPEYIVCTKCYSDHIASTHFAQRFERYREEEGSISACSFWSPRLREVLWPQAVQSNDLTAMKEVLQHNLTVPPCKGLAWTTGGDSVRYYTMANSDIEGFITCEACYEDYIAGTQFEHRFSLLQQQQGNDEKWRCDTALPYIKGAIVKMSKNNDWSGFVERARVRLAAPTCEGTLTQSNRCNWYRPRRTIEGMHICEACYLDQVALTQFADKFERHMPRQGFDGFMDSLSEMWKCTFREENRGMASALEAAIYQRNYDVFWNAANTIIHMVPCTKHGIIRGDWWTVAGGCDGVSVCKSCYHGILETSDLGRFFEPAERDPTIDIVCSFCPESPRFGEFVNKLAESLDKGVFSYYTDYVKIWAGVPSCPGIKSLAKAIWWGYPEALFCQECFLRFVSGTSLASSLPIKGAFDERTMICQIWSPRMRKMWLEVCAAGPPGSAESDKQLQDFRAFGTRRLEVYCATVPRIEMIEGMRTIQMQQAMHQGLLSVMYRGMNSTAVLSDTTDGYWHGNSSVGWYETEHGVTAADMMNMRTGMANANSMGGWMEVAQLRTMWTEVE